MRTVPVLKMAKSALQRTSVTGLNKLHQGNFSSSNSLKKARIILASLSIKYFIVGKEALIRLSEVIFWFSSKGDIVHSGGTVSIWSNMDSVSWSHQKVSLDSWNSQVSQSQRIAGFFEGKGDCSGWGKMGRTQSKGLDNNSKSNILIKQKILKIGPKVVPIIRIFKN